ncbi:MAG: E3 binding domain-containing protein, partial [Deinococcales bacterium]
MSQPEISPLARRLAEENNVDWRDLHGSGAGGKVVERDVLEYLARVMAGEEDIDPTPEPVPEGMESWPEEDIQAFQQEVSASHQNVGLQQIPQELSASDRLSHGPSEPSLEGGPVPPVDEVPPA